MEVLQWLRSPDPPCPLGQYECRAAAAGGYLEVLQWLRSQDAPFPCPSDACKLAAANGHLAVLQWLKTQAPLSPWMFSCDEAARHGHLEVLKWLRSQDPPCPWSAATCEVAARAGHLKVLQWLRLQQPACPWGSYYCSICMIVVKAKNMKMLGWMLLHGCPVQHARADFEAVLKRVCKWWWFMACVVHQRKSMRRTPAYTLGDHLLKLPPDVLQHISLFVLCDGSEISRCGWREEYHAILEASQYYSG